MCGIVGYVGEQHPEKILIDGLKKLEYRGYDSSGIALMSKKDVQIIKSVGRIINLENTIKESKVVNSNLGIAHTRWATHGGVTEANAHPHRVGKVTLVHNGIIENANVLRDELKKEKVKFNSETDTEVAVALINKYYDGNALYAIKKATSKLKGSYAFAIMFDGDDKLYAIRKDSPLIIGYGKNENFIASDIAAIINYTKDYSLLDEGEIAILDKEKIEVFSDGEIIKKKIIHSNITSHDADKCGYDHFMLKEIMEEPKVLDGLFKRYSDFSLLPDISKYKEIHIVACGSAMYAGIVGASLIEEKCNIKCYVECASEYRYKKVIYDRKTLVILISQSGETADTIAAMRKAKEEKIDTLAIVNVETSTIARDCDKALFIGAGVEVAVATTKAYILQVAMLSLLVIRAINDKKALEEAKTIPGEVNNILGERETFESVAKDIYKTRDAFFIGRGIDYAMCMEGSLKLKEVSYIHSDAFQAGELKHGTISLIEKGIPVFAIITDERIKDKTESNVVEVVSRDAFVYTITNDPEVPNHRFRYVVPKVSPYFQALLVVPVLQLIGYYTAKFKGLDIDKPRNLAKSVTVE
ncbi:MAG: glutamine--fructose-6-phosphate transaminase (isomerizing) [Bacilli bacterium]|nr:glutamine--fructose-6-phosphate transaminase (isomerizing) [Bacilli bacterium]